MAGRKLIMVIDDDPDILSSLRAVLEGEGFIVSTQLSAREGINALATITPDLILCDMMMERIDSGTRVADEIKLNHPSIPIYLLSSIGNATAANVSIEQLGFDGAFQKPVSPEALVASIRKTLEK
ncbi:MAG TPA: response regulator [Spirochaetota bacterium]|nr:response regulator [Spirochaetota bacterium]